jgi:hypothetical protein
MHSASNNAEAAADNNVAVNAAEAKNGVVSNTTKK